MNQQPVSRYPQDSEDGPCKYCGHKTHSLDIYQELACNFCQNYFEDHPTFPTQHELDQKQQRKTQQHY